VSATVIVYHIRVQFFETAYRTRGISFGFGFFGFGFFGFGFFGEDSDCAGDNEDEVVSAKYDNGMCGEVHDVPRGEVVGEIVGDLVENKGYNGADDRDIYKVVWGSHDVS
jgi:hypothetical protein